MGSVDPALWADPEIAGLERELAALGEELASAEAELADARVLLRTFRLAHDRLLAPLYAQLDEIEARIAEACAADSRRPDDVRDARAARQRAHESARAADAAAAQEVVPPAAPPPARVRSLYRALARRCHPDLGGDDPDLERRLAFMVRVNDAYAHGDVDLLTLLDREWDTAEAAAPARTGGPDRLARLRAAVQAARSRLAQVRAELALVTETGLGPLLFGGQEQGMRAAMRRLDTVAERLRTALAERRKMLDDVMRARP